VADETVTCGKQARRLPQVRKPVQTLSFQYIDFQILANTPKHPPFRPYCVHRPDFSIFATSFVKLFSNCKKQQTIQEKNDSSNMGHA
jgi:hypothetical protein